MCVDEMMKTLDETLYANNAYALPAIVGSVNNINSNSGRGRKRKSRKEKREREQVSYKKIQK